MVSDTTSAAMFAFKQWMYSLKSFTKALLEFSKLHNSALPPPVPVAGLLFVLEGNKPVILHKWHVAQAFELSQTAPSPLGYVSVHLQTGRQPLCRETAAGSSPLAWMLPDFQNGGFQALPHPQVGWFPRSCRWGNHFRPLGWHINSLALECQWKHEDGAWSSFKFDFAKAHRHGPQRPHTGSVLWISGKPWTENKYKDSFHFHHSVFRKEVLEVSFIFSLGKKNVFFFFNLLPFQMGHSLVCFG